MHRTRIKICGITRPQDARAAVDAGADAIGMILHANAPRAISRDIARQIVDAVPDHVDVVGVFVDADASFMRESARELKLDRKSTRLNSSHLVISYAVFCLKKKTNRTCQ